MGVCCKLHDDVTLIKDWNGDSISIAGLSI